MAQLGKLYGTVQDSRGNPVSGATVTIRRQGATVNGAQAGPTYTVDDPGGILVADQVVVGITTVPQRNVSAVALTSVTTGGPGLGSLADDDRITIVSPLPTLYNDAQGTETKANPLTADANGYWECWALVVPYDVRTSATGYGTKLESDKAPDGQEDVVSNVFSNAGSVAFRRSTSRTLTAGTLATWENPRGTTKISFAYDGSATFAGNGVFSGTLGSSGNMSVGGNLSVTGTLGVTGLSTLTGGATVASAFTYSGVAGSFSLTAGSIETADLAANAVTATRVGTGSTDQTLTAAAAYADVVSATVTFTPFSSSSEIVVEAVVPMESAGAGGFTGFARIVDGTAATIYHEAGDVEPTATANLPITVPLLARLTGLTGSQTFKVQARCNTNNAQIMSSSTDRKCRIVVTEYKR